MNLRYKGLKRAIVTRDFLHSNATTHDFLFGALAEIVDNSRDAEADNLHIFTIHQPDIRGKNILCFLDDGIGMDPDEAAKIIELGSSQKQSSERDFIGQYGNGLKSGGMRIGTELLVFTKKCNFLSIIYISTRFLNEENITEILVPLPSFLDDETRTPFLNPDLGFDTYQHAIELEIIYKYSPFKNRETLLKNFDRIQGKSGTLVMIFNLMLDSSGYSELDFDTDRHDILMRGLDVNYKNVQMEHRSFRAYVSILYSNPRMRIFIQNKPVQARILVHTLYKPARYDFASKAFKKKANDEAGDAEHKLKLAIQAEKEALSQLRHQESKYSKTNKTVQDSIELTSYKRAWELACYVVSEKKLILEKCKKSVNSFKCLEFYFGINVMNRDAYGLFIYNGNRLLVMYEPPKNDGKEKLYRGIVGIVDVPYFVAKPTHNKQNFADQKEFNSLVKNLSEHMESYNKFNVPINLDRMFWNKFGYLFDHIGLPSDGVSPTDMLRLGYKSRLSCVRPLLQCSKCLKWRKIRYHPITLLDPGYFKDGWECKDNTDPERDSCNAKEEFDEINLYVIETKKPDAPSIIEIERSTPSLIQSQKAIPNSIKPTTSNNKETIKPNGVLSRPDNANNSLTSISTISINGKKRLVAFSSHKDIQEVSDDEFDPFRRNSKKTPSSSSSSNTKKDKKKKRKINSDDDETPDDTRADKNYRAPPHIFAASKQRNLGRDNSIDDSPMSRDEYLRDIQQNTSSFNQNNNNAEVEVKNEPLGVGIEGLDQFLRNMPSDLDGLLNTLQNEKEKSVPLTVDPSTIFEHSSEVVFTARDNELNAVSSNFKVLLKELATFISDTELAQKIDNLTHSQVSTFSINEFFEKFKRALGRHVSKEKNKVTSAIKGELYNVFAGEEATNLCNLFEEAVKKTFKY